MMTTVKGLAVACALGLLALFSFTPALGADGEIEIQSATGGTEPDVRLQWSRVDRLLCIGLTDEACAKLVVSLENNPLLVVVGDANDETTSDAAAEVVELSERPNDPRALACFNVRAQGSLGQFCAYGTNYPGGGGQTKFAGYNGVHVVAYTGPIQFIVGTPVVAEVARINAQGFGIHDEPNAQCSGCFSIGIGSWVYSAPRPWWGFDIFAKMAPDGIVRPHVRHSDGSIRCLTC